MLSYAIAALWLSSSNDGRIVLYAALGFVIGILLFVRGFRALQRERLITMTPRSKVRSAAIGLVELTGQAVGPHTLTSPITQRPCFFYRTALWQEVGSGKDRHWKQVLDERFHVPFFLRDETGMVLVDPNGAEMDIHCDFKGEYHESMFSGANVPPRVAELAASNGIFANRNLRVEEYCLKPQNALYILGTFATNYVEPLPQPQPTAPAGSEVAQGLSATGGLVGNLLSLANVNFNVSVQRSRPTYGPVPLTETDRRLAEGRAARAQAVQAEAAAEAARHPERPQPKRLDPNDPRAQAALAAIAAKNPVLAAEAAAFLGATIPQKVAATTAAAVAPEASNPAASVQPSPAGQGEIGFPEKNPTIIRKGTNDTTFYISWRSQKEIVSDLSTRAFLMIFGGPALSALCLWVLLNYFRML